jgi:N4-gp56 family major capsid protein
MATTAYGTNDALAVKLWSKKLAHEALKETFIYKFIGDDENSLIQMKEETTKSPGDKITVGLRMQLTGDGVAGDGTLEGNEEALTTYSDAVLIDQLRHAVRSAGKMTEQRVPFSVREEARMGLQDWFAGRADQAFFNQVGGNTAQSDQRYTGSNATVAPSSNNWVFAGGATAESSISATTTQKFSLTLIDVCVEKAKTLTPMIRPIRLKGDDYYVMFLHPYQVTDLRIASAAAGSWYDIQKAAITGGQVTGNPIFTGALGMYNNVILHTAVRIPVIPSGTLSTQANVYRATFCGAQAAAITYGRDNSAERFSWVEELFDYGNQLGVSAGCIWGLKKLQFNSQDFGTIVASTYAAARTGS